MDLSIFVFAVFIIQVCTVNTQTTGENDSNGSKCTDAEGRPGQCVEIHKCSHLASLLKPPITEQNKRYVQNSRCEGTSMYSVCCGPQKTANIQKRSPQGCDSISATPPDPATECCGVGANVESKLIGGTRLDIDQYPWLALLEYHKNDKVSLSCAGTLISGQYVLTTAHCLAVDMQKVGQIRFVRLGEYDTATDGPDCVKVELGGGDCTEGVTRIPVEQIIPHPEYNPKLFHNDIGLIRLKSLAPYTDFIRPICLPSSDVTLSPPSYFPLFVAGWGSPGKKTTVKSHTDLQYVDSQKCQEAYNATSLNIQLWNKQVCAGGEKDKNSCVGTSGGPLMYENTKTYEAIGIVSFGPRGCGTETPDVFTKVYEYKEWILNNIHS